MPVPAIFNRLRIPVIGAPLFIVSNPELVIAQCKAGIVGSFPALNARPQSQLDEWIHQINEALATHDRDHPDAPSAPFAVNQIVHRSNDRFEEDMAAADDRPQVLHRLRTLGSTRHGHVGFHRCIILGPAAAALQRRRYAAGFHLHRRYRQRRPGCRG